MEIKPAYGIEQLAKAGPLRRSSLFNAIRDRKLIARRLVGARLSHMTTTWPF